MSTPKTPGPRLPDKPVRPPTIVRGTPEAEPPTDTASVLERLRAAQPRTVALHDGAPDREQPAPGAAAAHPRHRAAAGAGGEASVKPFRGPGSDTAGTAAAEARRGAVPGAADARTAGQDPARPDTRRAEQPSDDGAVGSAAGARTAFGPPAGDGSGAPDRLRVAAEAAKVAADRAKVAAERARVAADRARVAAGKARTAAAGKARIAAYATYTAARRGSTAAVHHVGTWDLDIVRPAAVTVCAVVCILGSAAGVGAFGGPSIRDAAGGLFAPDATLLAPSSPAFSIWSVIYAGLVAFTVFQWLPSQRRSERQRRLGWLVAASMLLNPAWILSAQAGLLALSLVVILLLFFVLLAAVHILNLYPNETRPEGAFVDTPIGLYLGWVLLASAANAAALLTAAGADLFGWGGRTWAVLGIITVLMAAAVICSTDRGRLAVAAATSWGLLWIAVERLLGQPAALNVAFVAALAIFLLLITAGSRRHRVDHAYRRWLRAEQDAQREPLDLLGDDYEDSRY